MTFKFKEILSSSNSIIDRGYERQLPMLLLLPFAAVAAVAVVSAVSAVAAVVNPSPLL